MRNKFVKGLLTVVGAIGFSTLGIFASDVIRGVDGGIGNLANVGSSGTCPSGAVAMKSGESILCVDMYEASPGGECPHGNPRSIVESEGNANSPKCYAASVPGKTPWSFISLPQAQRMCAQAGKRLPSSAEWYRFALGTESAKCNTNTGNATPGGEKGCASGVGVQDAVGNVWEWVDATVQGKQFEGRDLPPEGYVASVDAAGVAITSTESPQMLYGSDYVWTKEEGVYGMIRGGFYGSGEDAGLYTVNAAVPTSFASQGVGFRCVQDVL